MKILYLFVVTIYLTIASCSTSSSSDKTKAQTTLHKKDSISNGILADTAKVKKWLTGVIENYANGRDNNSFEILKQSLTTDYYNYKQDAMNLGYDSGDTTMTEESFKKKWEKKYDTRFVGKEGIIISAQDNGKIKVKTIYLIKQIGQTSSLYKVIIDDFYFKTKFNRDIKVIAQNKKLYIDDILEYN